MYVKPEVTKYCGKELLDLMGPVETGYCDIDVIERLEECNYALIVDLPVDFEDYRERLGWRVIPEDTESCGERSGVIPGPADECFGGPVPVFGSGDAELAVDLCCLARCMIPGDEQWVLDLTFFRNGTEDTCGIELEVGN